MTAETHACLATHIVLWPADATTADTSLTDASPEELRHFAQHYADVPLLTLMQRLRTAEWNAAYYQEQLEAAQAREARMPPLHVIQETDARHKRLKALLAQPGRISRSDLEGALAWTDDRWDDHLAATGRAEATV